MAEHNGTLVLYFKIDADYGPDHAVPYFKQWFDLGFFIGGSPSEVMGFSSTPFIGFIDLTTGLVRGRTNHWLDEETPSVDQLLEWAEEANQ